MSARAACTGAASSCRGSCATCSTTPTATPAPRVSLSLQNGADAVELTVDDDGPGIAPEDRERVFERFTRLDDGRARDAGGLGLGLSMVKTIVERHGGTVEVDDAPIGGARFAVRLPAA